MGHQSVKYVRAFCSYVDDSVYDRLVPNIFVPLPNRFSTLPPNRNDLNQICNEKLLVNQLSNTTDYIIP